MLSRAWGIRAGRAGQAHDLFLSSDIVALEDVGLGDLRALKPLRTCFYSRYRRLFPDASQPAVSGIGGKYYRFVHEVAVGDLVLYPAVNDLRVYLGVIASRYRFTAGSPFPHQRRVRWQYVIPKAVLSRSARNELGAARTFFEVRKMLDEVKQGIERARWVAVGTDATVTQRRT